MSGARFASGRGSECGGHPCQGLGWRGIRPSIRRRVAPRQADSTRMGRSTLGYAGRGQHSYRSPIIGPPGNLMMGGQQIIILKEGTEREKGKGAVFNNIAAARAVADAVKSTLGPKGMGKMLVDSPGDVTITNDGVTIPQEIVIENTTAKKLVAVAKTQKDGAREATTMAFILA